MKIRRLPDRSGSGLIKIRQQPDLSGSGSGDPEPKFGETFSFALFLQGWFRLPVFCPVSPDFVRFLPHFVSKCPFFARFCPVSPGSPHLFGFAQICQTLFVFVCRAHAQFATPWSGCCLIKIRELPDKNQAAA